MTKPGRNDPCHCGSGIKYKKCCAVKMQQPIQNLKPGIRMKGGVSGDPISGYHAIVHSWDNTECNGLPDEWTSDEVFTDEEEAMTFYKSRIRPMLEQLMSEAAEDPNASTLHRRLE
jgi:hypothetical protein